MRMIYKSWNMENILVTNNKSETNTMEKSEVEI